MALEANDQLATKEKQPGPESTHSNTVLEPEPQASNSGLQPGTREAVGTPVCSLLPASLAEAPPMQPETGSRRGAHPEPGHSHPLPGSGSLGTKWPGGDTAQAAGDQAPSCRARLRGGRKEFLGRDPECTR